jgi:ABC-type molybdenum transport system ATPase subunit/photorepair protein PhrA
MYQAQYSQGKIKMGLSKSSLKQKLETELRAQGFVLEGEFAMAGMMAEAIANAVVDEITQNAKANVGGGSSAGEHPII